MSRIYIGIDPGVSGALAIIAGEHIHLHDTPTRKASKGEEYLPAEMAALLEWVSPRINRQRAFAALEAARAPFQRRNQGDGDGKSSGNMNACFKVGEGFGLWKGILAGLGIAYEIPTSQAWKKALSLPPADDERTKKLAAKALAQQLFPQLAADLAKRRADFSEALLLAEWARRRDARQ